MLRGTAVQLKKGRERKHRKCTGHEKGCCSATASSHIAYPGEHHVAVDSEHEKIFMCALCMSRDPLFYSV